MHIKSAFDCVYIINGEFIERADTVNIAEFDVIYVTALPIRHDLLPYTVKLDGARTVMSELYCAFRLDDKHFLVTLEPRYMTVYRPVKQEHAALSPATRLFSLIKNGDAFSAYAMLSDSLKATVDKNGLIGFFDGFERIEDRFWEDAPLFYLIDGNGNARLHRYSLADGFIDNIEEVEPAI